MGKVIQISKKVPEKTFLPDGWYVGKQSAYKIEVIYKNEQYVIEVDEGVRGVDIPVAIKIENGDVQIEYLKN